MLGQKRQREVDAGYERVGQRVELGEVGIAREDAEELRDYVARDFFSALGRRAVVEELSEAHDVTRGRVSMHGFDPFETDALNLFSGVTLRHDSQESWQLRVMQTSYRSSKRDDKKRVHHHIEVMGGQLLIAKKEARLAQGSVDYFADIDTEETAEVATSTRKVYERPIDAQDCNRLQRQLAQAVRYLHAVGR